MITTLLILSLLLNLFTLAFVYLMISTMQRQITTNLSNDATKQKETLDSFAQQLYQLTHMNERKLEQMRETVSEKLQSTLERRLSESFQHVSERLEAVHRGLGEMQGIAEDVGGLKKALNGVKTRGVKGEIQLENLLQDILTEEQYVKNAKTKPDSRENVEFAIKIPSKDDDQSHILLPIDAKFPIEDYYRLVDAQELGDQEAIEESMKKLEARIKQEAKSIQTKYIHPPHTTNFAVLFLPTEGLFAEVLRRRGLWEQVQKDHQIVITGPTTLSAFLNSLQMGFRTLALSKRSTEIQKLLIAIRKDFHTFGDLLDKTQKKLQSASTEIDNATKRSKMIEKKLAGIEELPFEHTLQLLPDYDE